jgi:gamma-glutamylcyclotransferase (GGCT)/AIG2-like uncharacterized protein YtfP
MVCSFFAYGTLKRGQCRAHLWPATPLAIQPAWTYGQLFARCDYPAMIAETDQDDTARGGTDRVWGEHWTFAPADIATVISVLDEIEEVNQPGQPDLYRRVVVPVFDSNDQSLNQAYVYSYASNPELDGFVRVQGDPVQWPESI